MTNVGGMARVVGLCLLLDGITAGAATIHLTVLPGTVRVGLHGPAEGAPAAEVFAAKNETESFQVVVTALDGNLTGVTAEMSALIHAESGASLKDSAAIYREIFVPVRCSAPRATCPPDLIADPLVPSRNPYTGEPITGPRWKDDKSGVRFGGTGFDVWQGQHQPLWVDIAVPKDAAAGTYTATFRVSAKDAEPVEIPVRLIVWDFELPDGPTHENHFGGFHYLMQYHKLDANSDSYRTLEQRYIEMMAAHRLNPPLPRDLRPMVKEDGTVEFDAATDARITEFVRRYHVTNIEVWRPPFPDILNADRPKALNYLRSYYTYLAGKGWEKGAYLYMLDEPNDADAYEEVRKLGAMVKEAEPKLRRLVVEQPYTQDPSWGTLDGSIDIWCPLFGFVHEPSIKRVKAQGDEVWSYTALVQPAPPYHPEYETVCNDNPPYWQLDFPLLSYRIAPWLNRRYGISGLLYWSTVCWAHPERNPWDDPGFRYRFNGEGFLFYPGQDAGIKGPVASVRLKNLRDGMEDYEYFAILEARGGMDVVDAVVRTVVPTWATWDQDPYRILEFRRRLAEEIVRRSAGAS